ncbi:hypothetical protein WMF26_12895 [Sorangium sp. So ce185]|uniref:hypothetical protein n=1 Tax=Sorangium sp. So ce185 TaxID=3133287 RepID=UPI003F60F450
MRRVCGGMMGVASQRAGTAAFEGWNSAVAAAGSRAGKRAADPPALEGAPRMQLDRERLKTVYAGATRKSSVEEHFISMLDSYPSVVDRYGVGRPNA